MVYMEVDVKMDIVVDNGWMNKEIDKEKVEKWAPGRSCWRLIQPVLWDAGGEGASDRRLFAADP